jgi:hypothetical protein
VAKSILFPFDTAGDRLMDVVDLKFMAMFFQLIR